MVIKALFLNCTLKPSTKPSHTQKLIDIVAKHMQQLGAETESIRIRDYEIPFGIHTKIADAKRDDCSPIWFGVRASVTQLVLERISGMYDERDARTGQYPLYNKVAACIVTGNEDGAHNVIANTLYNLTHMGCTIPPNADCYWLGEAGPGPSFGDDKDTLKNAFTNQTAKYLAHNTVQMAQILKINKLDINLNKIDAEIDLALGNTHKHVRE